MTFSLLLLLLICGSCAAKLEVFLIPHSHCDAGWKKTVEQYYEDQVRTILDASIKEVLQYPTRRFVWAEIVYFSQWFDEQDGTMQQAVRDMVQRGQLEFVHAGWVMDDEASTEPISRINQLTLGHEELERRVGVRPTIAWSIDPFGSSSFTPTMLRAMGYRVYVNDRISLRIKEDRKLTKQLQFIWEGSASLKETSQLFTHTLDSWYWLPSGFNFDLTDPAVTPDNLHQLSTKLMNEFLTRAAWFRTPHLLFPFGHDFAFDNANAMFSNMDQLLEYINRNNSFGITAKYATLSEYFDAVLPASTWETFRNQDYLPFEDIPWGGWWSGHFTSRPQLKQQMRQSDAALRAAEASFAVAAASNLLSLTEKQQMVTLLDAARKTSALLNHHDAATGTSKQTVVDDYYNKLLRSQQETFNVIGQMSARVLNSKVPLQVVHNSPLKLLAQVRTPIVFFNSLGFEITDVAMLQLEIEFPSVVVTDSNGREIDAQLQQIDKTVNVWTLIFPRNVPALGFSTYYITLVSKRTAKTTVEEWVYKDGCSDTAPNFFLNNDVLRLEFSSKTNRPISLINLSNGINISLDQQFLEYASNKSGAYLFTPSGPAAALTTTCPLMTRLITGPISHMIEQHYEESRENNQLTTRIYLHKQSASMHVQISSNLPIAQNRELVVRFTSNINNQAVLYTDNGMFEMLPHAFDNTWDDVIASNYRPLLTTALIQDSRSQLVVVAAQPHGVASLASGQMEVMLQRRLMQDDNLGMDEAMNEQAPFIADFEILLNAVTTTSSLLRKRSALALDFSVVVMTPTDVAAWSQQADLITTQSALKQPLDDHLHLLSFESRGAPQDSDITLRLVNIFESSEDPTPVQVDLSALFVWPLANAEERGLSLGPLATLANNQADTISPAQIRTWKLQFESN